MRQDAAATVQVSGVNAAADENLVAGPSGLDKAKDDALAVNTVADNPLTAGAATINLNSTSASSGFPAVGAVQIENEVITYTGNAASTLTGCTRGARGTVAAQHAQNVAVKFADAVDVAVVDTIVIPSGAYQSNLP